MTKQCKDCKNDFELTNEEADFFTGRGLDIPKRCKNCRLKKKEQQNKEIK